MCFTRGLALRLEYITLGCDSVLEVYNFTGHADSYGEKVNALNKCATAIKNNC
jgi:hypothetical protein